MKYDNCNVIESQSYKNENIIRQVKKKKVELIDIFIVQAAICVVISIGFVISRLF